MKLLASSQQINQEVSRLLRSCSACEIAVAWASHQFEAFEILKTCRGKIRKMIVGTHLYQTHPEFIKEFMGDHAKVCFIPDTGDLFHPKMYLFEMMDAQWECVIGSANFTSGGFCSNHEIAVVVNNSDNGANTTIFSLREELERYWSMAIEVDCAWLAAYREHWKMKQRVLRKLRGKFGNLDVARPDDGGKPTLDVEILNWPWTRYLDELKKEKVRGNGTLSPLERRLKMLERIREYFGANEHVHEMPKERRRKIAGLVNISKENGERDIDFWSFGRMREGQTRPSFGSLINDDNDRTLSDAIDVIPLTGDVSKDMYRQYVDSFRAALPKGGGVATASRLLAVKRPDTFVCVDKPNKKSLCEAFGIRESHVDFETYWESIIERVRESLWWNAPPPAMGSQEYAVWRARAALLDALFYEPEPKALGI